MSATNRNTSHGVFVAVVGPSGAGKDTILRAAAQTLSGDTRYLFVRRYVTRSADATEDVVSVSREEFRRMSAEGAFAITWEAHGLNYALPASIAQDIAEGRCVIANLSRSVVAEARRLFADVRVVLIDAPAEIRIRRIAARGRESEEDVRERIARSVVGFDPASADLVVDNSGPLDDAVRPFVAWLNEQTHPRPS